MALSCACRLFWGGVTVVLWGGLGVLGFGEENKWDRQRPEHGAHNCPQAGVGASSIGDHPQQIGTCNAYDRSDNHSCHDTISPLFLVAGTDSPQSKWAQPTTVGRCCQNLNGLFFDRPRPCGTLCIPGGCRFGALSAASRCVRNASLTRPISKLDDITFTDGG